jgi:hypothetical protein
MGSTEITVMNFRRLFCVVLAVRGMTCAAGFAATESTPLLSAAFCNKPENHLEKEPLLPDTVPLGNALDSL